MNPKLVRDITDFLVLHMDTPSGRQALVRSALFGCPVLSQIDWEGDARTFTINLVTLLLQYGECEPGTPAIVALLDSMRSGVGVTHQATITVLIQRINERAPQQPQPTTPEAPKPVTLPASTPPNATQEKPVERRSGIRIEVIIGVIGLILAFAALIPEQTRVNLFQSLGLVAVPTATPTATIAPTNIPTLEPSITLEPTTAFTATFTNVPPSDTPTDTLTNTPTTPPPTDTPTATDPPNPTDLPTTAPTVASTTAPQSSSATLRLSREQDMFVVYAPQNPVAELDTITFRYTSGETTRTTLSLGRFPSFGLDFGALTQPACFVFRVQGDNTPLPMDCQSSGTLVFTQSLSNADVFWRDNFGQSLTLLVIQGETQLGLCGAGNASCEVSMGPPTPTSVAVVASATPTPTATITHGYPCAAAVGGVNRSAIFYVYRNPNYNDRLNITRRRGDEIEILGVSDNDPNWYEISTASSQYLGWMPSENVTPSETCP